MGPPIAVQSHPGCFWFDVVIDELSLSIHASINTEVDIKVALHRGVDISSAFSENYEYRIKLIIEEQISKWQATT